ncbi:MAG: hypothetical protein Tsb0010_04410 [Parvularculaceae bacterium]
MKSTVSSAKTGVLLQKTANMAAQRAAVICLALPNTAQTYHITSALGPDSRKCAASLFALCFLAGGAYARPMSGVIRIVGIDPGLRRTGWGVIEAEGARLRAVACGAAVSTATADLACRIRELFVQITEIIARYGPAEAAVEKTFVNRNPASALALGHARAAALLAPAMGDIPIAEYAPNEVKKSVVGVGHADKAQVQAMLRVLLPAAKPANADAADALAVAICHAHRLQSAGAIYRRRAS